MSYSSLESNTLSRRYELPTCLLEVWTERSPLSDWQPQIVAQNLRFRLQLAYGKKIIKGNQQQITNLIEAVTIYCDRWLALGRVHPAPLREWQRLIHAAQDTPEALHDFIQFLAAPDYDAEPLRSCSPFVGLPLGESFIPLR